MTTLDATTDTLFEWTRTVDCSAFLDWNEEPTYSEHENAVVFKSLVATLKLNTALGVYLEAKAVKFLKYVEPRNFDSADAFLGTLASTSCDSSTDFVQSIVVLISSVSLVITAATMKMLYSLIASCSAKVHLTLVKADLIAQLINTLNLLSLSFSEAVDIHINIMKSIPRSLLLATPSGLENLEITDHDEQQAVYETVFQQVMVPSEKYICHLCVNRFSIVEGHQSCFFLILLTQLLRICPYHQPTMDLILDMPVVVTIPSCLSFYTIDETIWDFLFYMKNILREWNKRGDVRQISKKLDRMLRMEGIEDVIEEKIQNDRNESFGHHIVAYSIDWNNQQGMNVPGRR